MIFTIQRKLTVLFCLYICSILSNERTRVATVTLDMVSKNEYSKLYIKLIENKILLTHFWYSLYG